MTRFLKRVKSYFQIIEELDTAKFSTWAITSFIILSLLGVVLRYMQLFPLPAFNYMFLLHAHSHFAFAAWMFFSLAFLISDLVSGKRHSSAFEKVFIATLFSSFGMVVSFSFQGYKAISIAFSTLFILVTYRFTYLVLKDWNLNLKLNDIAKYLILGSLILLCFSSLGPFALGPIMATSHRGSPVYQNAIYYYLHFQMNGWMLLAVLGLLANTCLKTERSLSKAERYWLILFMGSNIPLFAIFTLWVNPALWIWLVALVGSLIQLISWIVLCAQYSNKHQKFSFLVKAALLAITIKSILQVFVCIPEIAEWIFFNRNLIIGYIHLITLGCVSPIILDLFVKRNIFKSERGLSRTNLLYIWWVISYLVLLFLQPLLSVCGINIPYFQMILLLISLGFLIVGMLYFFQLKPLNSLSKA